MTRAASTSLASPVAVLITGASVAATAAIAALLDSTLETVRSAPLGAATFVLLALSLQLLAVPVYGRGSISVSAIGVLASGIFLGPGPAMLIAVLTAVTQWVRSRGLLYRAVFDAANLALAAGVASAVYALVAASTSAPFVRGAAALAAGAVYCAINVGLLSWAMSLAEGGSLRAIWQERFRWLTGHYVAFGPLAFTSVLAYEELGVVGLVAFTLPPALMIFSFRQYVTRTAEAVDEARSANEQLSRANAMLAEKNADLHDLFEFAGGLAARAQSREELVTFATDWLSATTGASVRIRIGAGSGGTPLVVAGEQVGSLSMLNDGEFDVDRWDRIRDAVLPQLEATIARSQLAEQVRKTHLATIAALSRSMESKDYYTGGHTERVAAIAVGIATRLEYTGVELEAIEIGALLHDIGKIGIPERILQKPGKLEPDEWDAMRQHPIVSDYILSEIDLHPVVRQIARSTHERMDGTGYPDGLAGQRIPLPARIVAVADAFDALTSDRPYRSARYTLGALEEITANAGTQFCPRVVAALEQLYREEPHVLASNRLEPVPQAV